MKSYFVCKYVLLVVILGTSMYASRSNGCLEEERLGLLELRELLESNGVDSTKHLPDWTETSRTDCCKWERVACDPNTGHVTELFLSNLKDTNYLYTTADDQFFSSTSEMMDAVWSINCSLFLPFTDLKSLNLSLNSFAQWDKKYGFEILSALKKLKVLDLSSNNFGRHNFEDNNIYQSLAAITSLKTLFLKQNGFEGSFPAHELVGLENLETLDLSYNGYEDWLPNQGFRKLSLLKKLETLNFRLNALTIEVLPYLNSFTSLKVLDLQGNGFGGSFPAHESFNLTKWETLNLNELCNLTNLESLNLRDNDLGGIQGLQSFGKFKKLTSLDLSGNHLNRTFFQSLSSLASLKNLFLAGIELKDPFPAKDLTLLENLEMLDLSLNGLSSFTVEDGKLLSKLNKMRQLDLSNNGFGKDVLRIMEVIPSLRLLSLEANNIEGTVSDQDLTFNSSCLEVLLLSDNYLNGSLEGLASLSSLKVLDLGFNLFTGSTLESIGALSSLKVLSLASNQLNGFLPDPGLCKLKKLEELDLSNNQLQGTLPPCLSNLKVLRYFDISLNLLTGNLSSSMVRSFGSLEYIDLSHNNFEGKFSLSSLANHSKLVVFEIISDNGKLVVETEDEDWFPMFQLKVLVLSNCNLNKLTGKKIPKFLIHQHNLRDLVLSDNNLDDLFPNWLLVNNTGLNVLNVRHNSMHGTFHLSSFHNTANLDFSYNNLKGKIQANIGIVVPFVSYLNLSNNAFEGGIPSSIGVMSELSYLDLSSNNLSGEVPIQLLGNCTSLEVLSLSNNSLHGQVFTNDFNLTRISILKLADNQFTGLLEPTFLGSDLLYLDVSNNNYSGKVSEFPSLGTVLLRNNSFAGEFPCSLLQTVFTDISFNSFSGSISFCPNQSFGTLKHLHLRGNNFSGPFPQAFLNLSALLTLDVSDNHFSGTIPMFLPPLLELRILLSKGNLLNGSIPSHLCRLNKISLMDLSNNLFTGAIPRCLNNITFGLTAGYDLAFEEDPMVTSYVRASSNYPGILRYQFEDRGEFIVYKKREEINFVTKSRAESYQGNFLNYMSGLDLSSNLLTGEIPTELGELKLIHALNLSHNHLTGFIPKSLSNLKQVESLDLSFNMLRGNIPEELTNLNSLAVFIVAHNNLSGTIPYGKAQFSTFNASSYKGNPGLCGPPLKKSCNPVAGKPEKMPKDHSRECDREWFGVDRVTLSAIVGGAYVTSLVATLTVLCINPNWRKWWFDLVEDALYSCYFFFSNLREKQRQ